MATAGELTVHETTLDGESTSREPFLEAGEGSAFVPRLGEVVLIRCVAGGLGDLLGKVEQLVDKGLHALVVELDGVGSDANVGVLCDVHAHVDRFLGWVCFCNLQADVENKLAEVAGSRDLALLTAADQGAALDMLRRRDHAPPSDSGATDPGDWGWGSSDDVQEPEDPRLAGLPEVDISELFVEADELTGLRDQIGEVMGRGRVHVTLRVHVPRGRRMQSEDVHALSEARDLLEGAGGQLVLVSLQAEFLQWLRLLDEEQHFQIVETAIDAERLHREHAVQGVAVLGPSLQLVSAEGDRFVVRAPEGEHVEGEAILTGRLIELAPAGLTALGPRIHALAEEGVQDVVVDLSAFQGVDGVRFEPVVGAVAAARARGVRLEFAGVSGEIDAMLKLLQIDDGLLHANSGDAALALAGEVYLRQPFAEATLALAREPLREPARHDDPVSSIEFASEVGELPPPAEEVAELRAALAKAQAEAAALREQAARREAEAAQAKQQAQDGAAAEREFLAAEQARRRAEEQSAELQGRVRELEARTQQLGARERELEGELGRLREQSAGAPNRGQLTALEGQLAEAQAQLAEARAEAERQTQAAAEHAQRVAALERAAAEQAQRTSELEQAGAQAIEDLAAARQEAAQAKADAQAAKADAQAQPTPATGAAGSHGNGGGDMVDRVKALEVEKARILTEAEQEIQRLLRNQQQLREELESAGDMIERLGKELELS